MSREMAVRAQAASLGTTDAFVLMSEVRMDAMLHYREYDPCSGLRPHVRCFWSFLAHPVSDQPLTHRVLPDGCLDIVFIAASTDIGAPSHLRAVGTMTTFLEVAGAPVTLGVRFEPGMARSFFALPAGELTDLQIDLADLWGDDGKRLHEQMIRASSVEERLGRLESALLRRLPNGREDRPIAVAAQRVLQAGGKAPLADLTGSLGLSERQLRRRFEDAVGLSPKRFARVVRFRALLDLVTAALESGPQHSPMRWAALAVDCGYYDQAHMISDFRAFTGQTPAQYFEGRRS